MSRHILSKQQALAYFVSKGYKQCKMDFKFPYGWNTQVHHDGERSFIAIHSKNGDIIYPGELLSASLFGGIKIHFDFSMGNEVSFVEGERFLENKLLPADGNFFPRRKITLKQELGLVDFTTHVLNFFCIDYHETVVVIKKNGAFIDLNHLFKNDGSYTVKEMRKAHSTPKMLSTESFQWTDLLEQPDYFEGIIHVREK